MATTARTIGIERLRIATDGEGVTSLVGLFGCPLRCQYCLNPHSFAPNTPTRSYTVDQLIKAVSIDQLYYLATGGGICFGGGEPLLHSAFIADFCQRCPAEWHISLETSINVPTPHLEAVAPYVHQWIIDVKDMDPTIYEHYTGQPNTQVVANLRWLADHVLAGLSDDEAAKAITLRLPLIPDFNTPADVDRSEEFLRSLGFTHFDRFNYDTQAGAAKRQTAQ